MLACLTALLLGVCPGGTWSQLDAGDYFTCGVKSDGELCCFGSNNQSKATPPAGVYAQVSAGQAHACAVTTAGAVACWGSNEDNKATPPTTGTYTFVVAAMNHSCALSSTDNSITCWGRDSVAYQEASPPNGRFNLLAGGYQHTCARSIADSRPWCWGSSEGGRLTGYPAQTVTALAPGLYNTCVILTGGTVFCWGESLVPAASPGSTFPLSDAISNGAAHGCPIAVGGTVSCWGYRGATPTAIAQPGGTFTAITVGQDHSCGIVAAGTVSCWGGNAQGQATPP